VSDLHGEKPGEAIEVAVALVVPDIAAVASLHNPHRVDPAADRGEVSPEVAIAEFGKFFVVHNGSLRWVGSKMRCRRNAAQRQNR
jgi:hypothetical protein